MPFKAYQFLYHVLVRATHSKNMLGFGKSYTQNATDHTIWLQRIQAHSYLRNTIRVPMHLPDVPSSSQFLPSPQVYSSLQFENGYSHHSSSPLSPIATKVGLAHN